MLTTLLTTIDKVDSETLFFGLFNLTTKFHYYSLYVPPPFWLVSDLQIINNYWMRLSGISRIIELLNYWVIELLSYWIIELLIYHSHGPLYYSHGICNYDVTSRNNSWYSVVMKSRLRIMSCCQQQRKHF